MGSLSIDLGYYKKGVWLLKKGVWVIIYRL